MPDHSDEIPGHGDDLDGDRVARISRLRRAAWRARCYCLIGALGCLAAAGQCLRNAAVTLHGARGAVWGMGWIAAGVISLWLVQRFYRRANVLLKEAQAAQHPPPDAPPDFSTLGDGSDRLKKLDQLGGGTDDQPQFRD